jgi:ubiquinol-cytochrome c reductase subunit 8
LSPDTNPRTHDTNPPPGCPTPQRITTYSLSPNRQRPLAGTFHAAVFNTFRRCRHQVLYVVPPFVAAYAAMNWAVERYVVRNWRLGDVLILARNEYLNSKPGRIAEGEQ